MGVILEQEGLAYSDVYLLPQLSDIPSRHGPEINTSTVIARGMPPINLPIISANMDTVTEAPMAIAMAQHGGIGIIHRFMSPDEEAHQVSLVKDKMRVMEDNPPMVPETATISDVLRMQEKRNRGYVIVYPGSAFHGAFSGIATTRDFIAGKPDQPIREVMTQREGVITVKQGTSLETAVEMMKKHRIEKIPIIDGDGNLVGVFTLKDDEYRTRFSNASLDEHGRLLVGAAIGVKHTDIERSHKLIEAGVDVLVLDIAHGGLTLTKKMLHKLKVEEGITTPIIAGNVATREGVLYIYDNGADGVKVGVGPGFVCTTRNVAGHGVPQVTAIHEAYEALRNKEQTISIIADGGIREAGDLPKAIGAGADAIMIGSLFAGTEESPGEPVDQDGLMVKMVRGMASASAFKERPDINHDKKKKPYTAEGRTTFTPFKGTVLTTLWTFDGGLRSGMSYTGAHTIQEMKDKAIFMKVTNAGATENTRALK